MNKLQKEITAAKRKLEELRQQVVLSRKTKLEKVLFRQLGTTQFKTGDTIVSANGTTLFKYVKYNPTIGTRGSFDERNDTDGWYTNYARPRELQKVRWATKDEKNGKAFNYRITIHEFRKPREVVCVVKTLAAAKAELMAARREWARRSKKNDKFRKHDAAIDYWNGSMVLTRSRLICGSIHITRIRAK